MKGCDESLPELASVIFLKTLIGFLFLFSFSLFFKKIFHFFLLLVDLVFIAPCGLFRVAASGSTL